MSKMVRKGVLALSLVALCLMMFPAESSAGHAWSSFHWARQSNPFTLKLGDNMTSVWDPYFQVASADWNASSVLNTTIVAGSSSPRQCKIVSGTVQVCNEKYGFNGWLGIAGLSVSGSHITGAYVKMNDSYFNTSTYNTPAWRQSVTCQEIGHAFGLDHQDENFNNANLGSCMDYTNDPSTNQHPNAHDFEQLETIYAHVDSTTTVKAIPAVTDLEIQGEGQWGRLVGRTGNGAASVYELDFGGGNRIITFVRWADHELLERDGVELHPVK